MSTAELYIVDHENHINVEVTLPLLRKEQDGYFFVQCPQLKTLGYSTVSFDEARENHGKDVNIFFQYHTKKNTLKTALRSLGWTRISDNHYEAPPIPYYFLERAKNEKFELELAS